uniref:Uncharacterized protein n=1 Tax=Cacopsylla melanoneura TaxID=428564 RepID=A0A8D9B6D4_9HEMI
MKMRTCEMRLNNSNKRERHNYITSSKLNNHKKMYKVHRKIFASPRTFPRLYRSRDKVPPLHCPLLKQKQRTNFLRHPLSMLKDIQSHEQPVRKLVYNTDDKN